MPIWILSALGWLKGLPWQVYAGLALMAAFPITYCKGVHDGREDVLAEFRQQEKEQEQKAVEARKIADEQGEVRAEVEEAKQEALNDAIEEAEAIGDNPLDAVFSGELWGGN